MKDSSKERLNIEIHNAFSNNNETTLKNGFLLLGAFLPQDPELLRRQDRTPLFLWLIHRSGSRRSHCFDTTTVEASATKTERRKWWRRGGERKEVGIRMRASEWSGSEGERRSNEGSDGGGSEGHGNGSGWRWCWWDDVQRHCCSFISFFLRTELSMCFFYFFFKFCLKSSLVWA